LERVKDACSPRLLEQDAADLGEDVDPTRGLANLNHDAGSLEVLWRDAHLLRASAELEQRPPDTVRVGGVWIHPDVEVAGGPRHAVHGHRMGTDDQEPRARPKEQPQEVEEILVHELG